MNLQKQSSNQEIFPQALSSDFVVQEAKDEILIYNLKTNKAFCLNPISASIWMQCNGRQSVSQIVQILKQQEQSAINEDLVLLTIKELNKNDLLLKSEDLNKLTNGFNRREAIRRIGMTTAMALPVISALLAPSAVNAQSGVDGVCQNTCTSGLGSTCNCNGTVVCPPGTTFNASATVGVCVSMGVGIPFIGVNIGAGTCVYANICV